MPIEGPEGGKASPISSYMSEGKDRRSSGIWTPAPAGCASSEAWPTAATGFARLPGPSRTGDDARL